MNEKPNRQQWHERQKHAIERKLGIKTPETVNFVREWKCSLCKITTKEVRNLNGRIVCLKCYRFNTGTGGWHYLPDDYKHIKDKRK